MGCCFPRRLRRTATLVRWRVSHPCLRDPDPFTHNSAQLGAGGLDDDFSSREFQVWMAAGHGAGGFDLARRRPELHPRTGAGLHRRRVPALQRRDPRCRPRDGLHGRQQIQLSPPCRAQFRPDPEPVEAAARPAGRPTVIRPATPRKAVSAKPRKAKKPATTARPDGVPAIFEILSRQTDALLWASAMNISFGQEERVH